MGGKRVDVSPFPIKGVFSGEPSREFIWGSTLSPTIMGLENGFPKIGVPQNGWFIMENPIKMDNLGVLLFLETPK